MGEELITLIFIIILISCLTIIWIFILIQTIKTEKVAKPFLISLFLFFFLIDIATFLNVLYYYGLIRGNFIPIFAFFLLFFAPIFLIFEIEKNLFIDMIIHSKYHVLSRILFSLYLGALILSIITLLINPSILIDYWNGIIEMSLLGIILGLFLVALNIGYMLASFFLVAAYIFLGIKSTGAFRKNCISVAIGWTLYFFIPFLIIIRDYLISLGMNISLNIPNLITYSFTILGIILSFFGLYRLYTLKNKFIVK